MMKLEGEAIKLAKAVLSLEKHGYIDATGDEQEELHCEQLRRLAIYHARNIQILTQDVKKAEHD